MTQLAGLEIVEGYPSIVDRNVLVHIADLPRLKYLHLGGVDALTDQGLRHSSSRFSHLRTLKSANIDGSAARFLLPNLVSLRHLDLYTTMDVDLSRDILLPLASCGQLTSFVLHLPKDLPFPGVAFEVMANGNKDLHKIEIYAYRSG